MSKPVIVALDFETADAGADSACALGLARVKGTQVVARESFLIRPPRPDIWYTHVHGLTWDDVKDAPPFAEHMDFLRDFWAGADALAAHNAGFDRRVLFACCDSAGLMPPALPWICTVKLARACWNIRPTRLPDVCRHLAIPLNHHDAGSDAAACAQVVADALSDGFGLDGALLG